MLVHFVKPRTLIVLLLLAGALFLVGLPEAATKSPPQSTARVTFARDIAPIMFDHCVSCHRLNDPSAMSGSSAFSLLTYADVRQHAEEIVRATRNRSMPPWLPEEGYGDFADSHRLSDLEISLIAEWVREGAEPGQATETPKPPHFAGQWQLGQPDLVIDASRAVSVPTRGPDVFWNFVFSPNIKTTRYVRAIEINPGSGLDMVHHANLMLDYRRSGRRQEASPGAGFPGMDVMLEHSPLELPSHFLFWKPGAKPWIEPDGLAWKLEPGTDLILNVHFMPMGMSREAKPSIGLYFTDKPPDRFPLLVELENDEALDIPAGKRNFTVTDEFELPSDVDVLAVYPHAHYLGHLLEGYATLPDGQRKWLVRIPDWNPDWQAVFHYRTPVFLPKGTKLGMRYSYDNSTSNPRNPNSPPERVVGGNRSTDEMAHLWFQLLPHDSANGRMQIETALLGHRVEKYPDDFRSRLALGALMIARLNPAVAVKVLEQAVRIDPKQQEARRYLGMALEAVGRSQEAAEQLRVAVELKPDDPEARYSLVRILLKSGNMNDAIENLRALIAQSPKNAQYHDDLGELLMQQNKPAEALEQFNRALALDPSLKSALEDREMAQAKLQAH
jgi:mono/diheme cytochrome c family protein